MLREIYKAKKIIKEFQFDIFSSNLYILLSIETNYIKFGGELSYGFYK